VAFSFCVFHKKNVPCRKLTDITQGCFNLYDSIQQKDKLPFGCVVEIKIIPGNYMPELNRNSLQFFGKKTDLTLRLQRKSDLFKSAFSTFV